MPRIAGHTRAASPRPARFAGRDRSAEFAPAAQVRPPALIHAGIDGTIEFAHPRASEASASVARRLILHGQHPFPRALWANRASERSALRPPLPTPRHAPQRAEDP